MLRGEVERLEELRYEGRSGEQVRGELLAYQAALRDTTGVLTAMARLRVDEHLLRIEEAKARIVVDAVNGALREIGISEEDAVRARGVVVQHLRAGRAAAAEAAGSGSW
jgi:hypothetical protein